MKFKLDENVTALAAGVLIGAGHEVDTVADERLTGAPDAAVMEAAQADSRVLVTFDLGFGDVRLHPLGSHPGVVVLRLADQQPSVVMSVLGTLVRNHDVDALTGCLVIVTERLVRIRRPDDGRRP